MKITDYPRVQTTDANDIFLLDGLNGTKRIRASNLADSLKELADIGTGGGGSVDFDGLDEIATPEMRRMLFRGKNLGTSMTQEQHVNILNGTFKGLFLGDYWEIANFTWRIVDFDYWMNTGDTEFTTHHIVVMPDQTLYNAKMNEDNTTNGGYASSKMYTTNLTNAKSTVDAAFGNSVLTHREYLINAATNGKPTGGSWYDSTVEIPNEYMIYGNSIFGIPSDSSGSVLLLTIDKSQLALFAVEPRFIITTPRDNYWLRDIVYATHFAYVNTLGLASYNGASGSYGVRPVFAVA